MTSPAHVVASARRSLTNRPWAAHLGVSRAFLDTAEIQTVADHTTEALIVEMRRDLWTDHLLAEEQRLPVTGVVDTAAVPRSVLVELPRRWWRALLRRPAPTRWCPVVGDAAYATDAETIPVTGSLLMRADYFAAFPEASLPAYPATFGPMRRMVDTTRVADAPGGLDDVEDRPVAMAAPSILESDSFAGMRRRIYQTITEIDAVSAGFGSPGEYELRAGAAAYLTIVDQSLLLGPPLPGEFCPRLLGISVHRDHGLRPSEWRLVIARTRRLLVGNTLDGTLS